MQIEYIPYYNQSHNSLYFLKRKSLYYYGYTFPPIPLEAFQNSHPIYIAEPDLPMFLKIFW